MAKVLSIRVPDADFEAWPTDSGVASAGGHLYFLGPEEISIVSPAGQVVRRLPFRKPDPKAIATKMYVSGGMIVVVLNSISADQQDDRRFLVLDENTGKVAGYYRSPDRNWTDVCLTRENELVFLVAEGKKQRIATARIW